MKLKKKIGVLIVLIFGLICLFTPFEVDISPSYIKVLGLVLVMFALYLTSATLRSRDGNEDQNENLKL